MNFSVNSKELEKLLSKVFPAIPARTPMTILENFLFELDEGTLTVSATDLDVSLRSHIPVTSEEKTKVVIPGKLLYDTVRTLEDTSIQFESNPDENKPSEELKIQLKTDNGVYSLSCISPDEFPKIPEIVQKNSIKLNGKVLRDALDKTSFAIDKESMSPSMVGVLFELAEEGLIFVSTDGRRLVKLINRKYNFPIEKSGTSKQYILPERAVNILLKLLTDDDLKINFTENNASFLLSNSDGDLELITKLISQRYPDYKSVIPLENENLLSVKRNDFLKSLRRMLLYSTSNYQQVLLSISENAIEISSEDINHGASAKESIPANYDGSPLVIAFNTSFLNDIISHIDNDDIVLKLSSPTKACIIEPMVQKDDEDLMMLLMPIRINT
ncbi:MAG: DNA polymerase III subunit beta [Ignavibacterium sp.]